MLELLEQLFRHVRAYIHSERFNESQVYAESPEHTTMLFDYEAEEIIIKELTESGIGFEIVTEERPVLCTSDAPTYRIVIDPVDGSMNVSRGVMTAGVALAVLPIDAPITPTNVQWALVGELYSGTVYQAQQGGGAFRNGHRCQVSRATRFAECMAGVNFDGRDTETLHKLIIQQPPLGRVRRSGSSAMDIVYVASGAYDAYIDIGNVLTAESFLASLSIVLEAGGIVTAQHGQPLRNATNLREVFSLVAAGTQELHAEILARIDG